MRKKLSLFLAVILAMSAITACSSSSSSSDTAATTAAATTAAAAEAAADDSEAGEDTAEAASSNLPEGPVEIQLWTDFSVDESVLTDAIAAFEDAYSDYGYTVVLDKFAGSERAARMAAAIEANQLPALFFSAWFTTTDFIHEGYVKDITDIAETVKDDIFENAYTSTMINGKSYMIGLYQSYFGLLYNADKFREAGLDQYITDDEYELAYWTLDDLEDILTGLKDYCAGTEVYPMILVAASEQADTYMLDWLCMYGGDMWTDGRSTAGSDENIIKALEQMIEWMNEGKTNSNVVTKDGTEALPDFQNQLNCISSGQITNWVTTKSSMESGAVEPFDMRMATVPQKVNGEDKNFMSNYIYGASVMNNGHDDEIAVAEEFLRWLLNDYDSLKAFNTCAFPAFKSVAADNDVIAENPLFPAFTEVSDSIWDFTGNVPGYVGTRAKLYPQLQAAFSGSKTAAEALADYSKDANEIIDEYTENSFVLN